MTNEMKTIKEELQSVESQIYGFDYHDTVKH